MKTPFGVIPLCVFLGLAAGCAIPPARDSGSPTTPPPTPSKGEIDSKPVVSTSTVKKSPTSTITSKPVTTTRAPAEPSRKPEKPVTVAPSRPKPPAPVAQKKTTPTPVLVEKAPEEEPPVSPAPEPTVEPAVTDRDEGSTIQDDVTQADEAVADLPDEDTLILSDNVETGEEQVSLLTDDSLTPDLPYSVPQAETLKMDLESLPMTFGGHWSLDRRPNPVTNRTECILSSRSNSIFDGYEQTNIQLLLTLESIYVKTGSNIDLGYPGTGMRVDNGTLRPFDGVTKTTNAEMSRNVKALYASMEPGTNVVVRLGFWPTWPVTETREASFPLEGIAEAIRALQACDQM